MNDAANKQPPFAEFLGINITHVSPERVTAELPVREELNNRFGIMHGGAIMALADNLGGTATTANLKDGQCGANWRRRESGMHATSSRPHHHGLADTYHPRRRQAMRLGHADTTRP